MVQRSKIVISSHFLAKKITVQSSNGAKADQSMARVRQSLGKQNASRPLMQKGRETFGHTLGVYLGARMDA